MKNISFILIISCLAFTTSLRAAKTDSFFLGSEEPEQVTINNRILAKVNGKAISVIDLAKKMDILFYREFPQYTSSAQARYQFYQANWRHVLQELVDKELIIADAEENKLPLSSGDIRQEMEQLFGPNIIANLDKVGLTYDDAWKIIQGDITLRRMLYVRVNTKAMRHVTPQDVRIAYEDYVKSNMRPDQWVYQVVTIRDKNPVKGAQTAHLAYQMLTEEHIPLSEIAEKIKSQTAVSKTASLHISEEYRHSQKEISPAYKEILSQLSPETYSQPSTQKSRADKSTVYRIFYLKELVPGGAPAFNEVESKLKDQLMDEAMAKESKSYIDRLRKHFDVQENTSEDFQPFSIK